MIQKINIKNYRNLKELDIPKLGRVNLIAGKNNAGKTSFLEALELALSGGDVRKIRDTLKHRGELNPIAQPVQSEGKGVEALLALFHNWEVVDVFDSAYAIVFRTDDTEVSFQLVQYVENKIEIDGAFHIQKHEISNPEDASFEARFGLKRITEGNKKVIYPILDDGKLFPQGVFLSRDKNPVPIVKANVSAKEMITLWDQIVLGPKEDFVVEALRIVDATIDRLTFVDLGDRTGERVPIVTLKNKNRKIALASMGDGINKVLKIILALVNAENGYLLIDEFENGLHHSAQTELWEVIFKFAYEHNVQVFATTHSYDSVYSFGQALTSDERFSDSKYFRLENNENSASVVEYDAEVVIAATEQGVETR